MVHLFEQVLAQRAADAAVLHLDHALFDADSARARGFHEGSVDVDLRAGAEYGSALQT